MVIIDMAMGSRKIPFIYLTNKIAASITLTASLI
jgi:hypothetical protein